MSQINLKKQANSLTLTPDTDYLAIFYSTTLSRFAYKDENGDVFPIEDLGLADLNDIDLTSLSNGQVLYYDLATTSWKNKTFTKSDVGLANVDNTSDLNKPISTATQAALDLKYNASNPSGYQTSSDVDAKISTHSGLSDPHAPYALLAGRSGGQTLRGGTGSAEQLVIESTSNSTKGMVVLNPSGGNVGIGTSSTNNTLDISKNSTAISAAAGFPSFRVINTNPTPGDGVTTHNFAAFFIECANAVVRGGMRVGSNTGGSQAGDSVRIGSVSAHVLIIMTSNTERARIDTSGNMGIGTTTPSTRLHVEGPVRIGQYTVATVPSASVSGAGTMIYVSDESGGAVMAFSDGTNWRRVTDRAIIS